MPVRTADAIFREDVLGGKKTMGGPGKVGRERHIQEVSSSFLALAGRQGLLRMHFKIAFKMSNSMGQKLNDN